MKVKVDSNGKINIGLNIVGKLENGYHLLDMTMHPITLSDKLTIEIFSEKGTLEITTNKVDIPTGKSNILFKIYDAFYKKTKLSKRRIEIYLEKIIPHQAGLGGGSSNGATFLKILNNYYNDILTIDEMIELGKNIGADIPFFILNKSSRVKGIGEELEVIKNNIGAKIIIIKPNFGVSTQKAYGNYKKISQIKMSNIDKIIENLDKGNIEELEKYIENNLEESLLIDDENIIKFKEKLKAFKNIKFFMSGSGSSYFGFLLKDIEESCSKLQEEFKNCEIFICNFK